MFRYQHACLENPKDKGAWPAIVRVVAHTHTHTQWQMALKMTPSPIREFSPWSLFFCCPFCADSPSVSALPLTPYFMTGFTRRALRVFSSEQLREEWTLSLLPPHRGLGWTHGLPLQYAFSSWASLVAQMIKNLPARQETQVRPLGQENPLEKEMATHSSILAWKNPMDRGAWWAAVHGITKSRTQLNDLTVSHLVHLWVPFSFPCTLGP